jgi:erythromycin esterase
MKTIIVFAAVIAMHVAAISQQATMLSTGFRKEASLVKDQKDIYTITAEKGGFLEMELVQKGIDLVIDVFDPNGHKLKTFDSPNGANGSELIEMEALSAGLYTLEVHPFDDPAGMSDSDFVKMRETNQGKYDVRTVRVYSAAEHRQKVDEENTKARRVIEWLSANTMTLKSVEAGSGFDDLMPLKEILKDVKYVGLGEATHGTREFFQMKHRMLEFLVREMGFTIFAIEASYAGCKNINEYVLNGNGDAHTALASQGFWTWDTEEVIEMIEWMREYNRSVSDDKKVKFAGFDIQVNTQGGGVHKIKEYLQNVDTIRYHRLAALLDSIELKSDSPAKDSLSAVYKDFLSFFVMSKGIYVQQSSTEEYDNTLAYCRTLGQLVDAFFMNTTNPRKPERNWRDYYMAGNFFDMIVHEKPGSKVVVWAHNMHVSHDKNGFVNGGLRPFGSYLQEAYGQAYYAFGFAFNEGGFQATEVDSTGKYIGLQEFLTNPVKAKSLEWYFAQTNKQLCILNIRDNNHPVFISDFLMQPLETRYFGATAQRNYLDQCVHISLRSEYDGLIFVSDTHRARPTKSAMGEHP